MKLVNTFLKDEQGQDLIEYTLLMAFIALAAIGILTGLKGGISGVFSTAGNNLTNAAAQ